MKAFARELGFAVLAWLIPLAISVAIFPLKASQPPLFESLIAVALAGSTVLLGCLYLRRPRQRPVAQGIKIGLVWMAANWALDGLMFSSGPMKMSFDEYAMDIGVAYFMIPIITIGLGLAVRRGITESER